MVANGLRCGDVAADDTDRRDQIIETILRHRGGTRRGARGTQFTSTSTDGGATFRAGGPLASGSSAGGLLGAASAQVQFVMSDALYRTGDGGNTWQPVAAVTLGPGTGIFVGFESAAVGRVVTDSGRTVWTTRDAGLTWTAHTFH